MRIAQFAAVGTADILVNDFIPKWGFPKSLRLIKLETFFIFFLRAVCKLMGMRKLITSAYDPMGNDSTEQVDNTMTKLIFMVVNQRQNNWDDQSPDVKAAFNSSVNAATGFTPNKVHLGTLLCLPIIFIESRGASSGP